MYYRIFASALFAGLLAGLVAAALQQVTTVPLILHAETFEGGGAETTAEGQDSHGSQDHGTHDHGAHDHGDGWAPEDGFERIFYTSLSSMVIGAGWALLLVALAALSGRGLSGTSGILWGAAGFAAAGLAPAVGLPPELPGSMAAEVGARQLWWLGCIAASAAALWLLALKAGTHWKVLSLVLLAAPHIIGAPHPDHFGGPVPPELAAHFATMSLAVQAVFWLMLGWLAGVAWHWMDNREQAA